MTLRDLNIHHPYGSLLGPEWYIAISFQLYNFTIKLWVQNYFHIITIFLISNETACSTITTKTQESAKLFVVILRKTNKQKNIAYLDCSVSFKHNIQHYIAFINGKTIERGWILNNMAILWLLGQKQSCADPIVNIAYPRHSVLFMINVHHYTAFIKDMIHQKI